MGWGPDGEVGELQARDAELHSSMASGRAVGCWGRPVLTATMSEPHEERLALAGHRGSAAAQLQIGHVVQGHPERPSEWKISLSSHVAGPCWPWRGLLRFQQRKDSPQKDWQMLGAARLCTELFFVGAPTCTHSLPLLALLCSPG